MPVLTDLRLSLTVEDVTSSWGARRARLASSRMTMLLRKILGEIEANDWIQPKISFDVWPIVSSGLGWLDLRGGSRIMSRTLGHHLPGAVQLAAGVCTVGDAVEKHVSEGFAASDRLQAVMLDEIGTLMLFRLGNRLEELIQAEAAKLGLEAGGVLSPGEDGFEISQLAAVVDLAHGEKIGVSQTLSGMLTPRKSVSMVVGFGTRMPKWSRGDRCAHCGARDRCPHRQPQLVEASP